MFGSKNVHDFYRALQTPYFPFMCYLQVSFPNYLHVIYRGNILKINVFFQVIRILFVNKCSVTQFRLQLACTTLYLNYALCR